MLNRAEIPHDATQHPGASGRARPPLADPGREPREPRGPPLPRRPLARAPTSPGCGSGDAAACSRLSVTGRESRSRRETRGSAAEAVPVGTAGATGTGTGGEGAGCRLTPPPRRQQWAGGGSAPSLPACPGLLRGKALPAQPGGAEASQAGPGRAGSGPLRRRPSGPARPRASGTVPCSQSPAPSPGLTCSALS